MLPPSLTGPQARLLWLCLVVLSACAAPATPAGDRDTVDGLRAPLLFGSDNRKEPSELSEPWVEEATQFTVALIDTGSLDTSTPGQVRLRPGSPASKEWDLDGHQTCSDVAFASQPAAARCNGVLIAPDLVLTAGSCISEHTCASTTFVFDDLSVQRDDAGTRPVAPAADASATAVDDEQPDAQVDDDAERAGAARSADGGCSIGQAPRASAFVVAHGVGRARPGAARAQALHVTSSVRRFS